MSIRWTWKKKKRIGRTRDRTGIIRIRIWCANHYTIQPELLKDAAFLTLLAKTWALENDILFLCIRLVLLWWQGLMKSIKWLGEVTAYSELSRSYTDKSPSETCLPFRGMQVDGANLVRLQMIEPNMISNPPITCGQYPCFQIAIRIFFSLAATHESLLLPWYLSRPRT